jgi:hypothetical protein
VSGEQTVTCRWSADRLQACESTGTKCAPPPVTAGCQARELTFLGDVWLPRAFRSDLTFPGEFIFNLESPITRGESLAEGKICLKSERSHIAQTFGRRPLAVCLANNHIMDYGSAGLRDTLQVLQREGISHFGAGTLDENCGNPLVLRVADRTVGFLGYVCPTACPVFARGDQPGVFPIELPRIEQDIRALREREVDRVVVMLHWGEEMVHLPRAEDIRMAQAIVEAGADLIISHHSHTVQGVQTHRGKSIFYGLGNCFFPDFTAPIIEPTGRRMFSYVQKPWSRQSLAVTYAVHSGEVSVQGLEFKRGTLKPARIRPRSVAGLAANQTSQEHRYRRRFARHAFLCNLRELAGRAVDKITNCRPEVGTADYGQQTTDCGPRTADNGLRTADH